MYPESGKGATEGEVGTKEGREPEKKWNTKNKSCLKKNTVVKPNSL